MSEESSPSAMLSYTRFNSIRVVCCSPDIVDERLNVSIGNLNVALKRTVINLLEHQLTGNETSVLAKGEKFAVAPRRLPVEEIISNIEAGIRGLPPADADEIITESARRNGSLSGS